MIDGTDARQDDPVSGDAVTRLLGVLDLGAPARTREDIFTGRSQPMPTGRVYGGQVLAQSIVAAARTLESDDRTVHSMHGYFLRPGDAEAGITFAVDRIHDGRSFSTRRTQAFQHGEPIFSMIASFQDDDAGVEHQRTMPDVPAPEEVSDVEDGLTGSHPMTKRLFTERPVDLRHVSSPIYVTVDGEQRPRQAVWMRVRGRLPDDPAVHRATLAYMSDLTIQESVLRAHGIAWTTPGLRVASLDHAMWWHRFARTDEWLLYAQESPNARGGRGLATGSIFTRDGVLVATVAQEIMVRIPTIP